MTCSSSSVAIEASAPAWSGSEGGQDLQKHRSDLQQDWIIDLQPSSSESCDGDESSSETEIETDEEQKSNRFSETVAIKIEFEPDELLTTAEGLRPDHEGQAAVQTPAGADNQPQSGQAPSASSSNTASTPTSTTTAAGTTASTTTPTTTGGTGSGDGGGTPPRRPPTAAAGPSAGPTGRRRRRRRQGGTRVRKSAKKRPWEESEESLSPVDDEAGFPSRISPRNKKPFEGYTKF